MPKQEAPWFAVSILNNSSQSLSLLILNLNEKLRKAYTGLPVVRVTQRTAALQLIFSSGASLRPFEGSPTCRASRGPLAHTFNYFVMSCPILRSFSLLSFRNKFSLKITKHALE